MKNLKKVLALVLVVALMMGFATVAGAADFTDSADVDHTEAVEVMTAIGVINGYPDGSFRPDGNVTRAQMAKMVAYIVSGGEDVGDLYAGATAFSDCLTHWARGYIAYANTTGIIAGVGNGRFNPDGNVTGVQAAKMMLGALGYDQTTEGYTGTGWNVNVLSDARTVGLLKGLNGVNMNAALSRENAAQLMFNALTCNMVKYDRGSITVGEGQTAVVIGGSGAEPVVIENEGKDNYAGSTGAGEGYQQMCELYFEDLKLTAGSPDAFGRPSDKWTYKTTSIGTYAAEADATYTASVKNEKIYEDLGLSSDVKAKLYQNSKTSTEYTLDNKDTTLKDSGNGVLVEAFLGEDTDGNPTVTITMVNTYVAKVDGEYDADDKELDLDDLSRGLAAEANSLTLSGDDFGNLDSFSDGDYVLVTVSDGDIQTIEAAEVVTGTVTTYTTNKNVTVDGTKYSYTKDYNGAAYDLNTDFDLVLDPYGYVIYASGVETSDDYVYVTDYAPLAGVGALYEARAFFQDGTTAIIDVNDATDADGLGWGEKSTAKAWYAYDEKNDSTYDLEKVTEEKGTVKGESITENGSASIRVKSDTNDTFVRGNNDTVFLVIRGTNVNTYTGIRNVPDIKAEASGVDVSVIENDAGTYAEYVAIYAADSEDVTITGTAADAHVYILDAQDYGTTLDSKDNRYYTYDAIVNGEVASINASDTDIFTSVGLYGPVTYDSNGYVESAPLIAKVTDGKALQAMGVDGDIDYSAGVLSFAGQDLILSDDVVIYINDGGTAKTVTASKLNNDYEATPETKQFHGTISWVVEDNEVIEVYVDEDAVANKTAETVADNVADAVVTDDDAWSVDADETPYEPSSSWTSEAKDGKVNVKADFSKNEAFGAAEEAEKLELVMNDTARFLGSLHRNGNAKEIVFDSTTYVWDDDEPLKGSNWYDASDSGLEKGENTLVAALVDWYEKNSGKESVSFTVDGVNVTVNYTVK